LTPFLGIYIDRCNSAAEWGEQRELPLYRAMEERRDARVIAHKVQAVVTEDGKLLLQGLPFQAGARVEVIVLDESADIVESTTQKTATDQYPLRGKQPYQFDVPFSPAVPLEDWDALK
jgi:hypothetical protein